MTGKYVQRLLPFDEAPAESRMESVRWQPSPEAQAAVARLKAWLTDPRTGRMTAFAEEAVDAVKKAVAEGKNSYFHKAEDMLDTLALWNERVHGENIPVSLTPGERQSFHETVEELLDCLHEQMLGRDTSRDM
jgi:hypothetical protein